MSVGGAVAAQSQCPKLEQILLAIAEKHASQEFGPQTVLAGPTGKLGALEPDNAIGSVAGLEHAARGAPQLPAVAFEQRAAIRHLGHLARQMIVAAHEFSRELCLWMAVHVFRRSLLLDLAEVEQQNLVRHGHCFGL